MVNQDGGLFGEAARVRLCGIDEAGRGPLAGPLVMAGVILLGRIYKITDSKRLDGKTRERLFERIVERSRYHLVIFDNGEIDRYGISGCLRRGLREIHQVLGGEGIGFLFDGNSNYGVEGIATMVKADQKIREVGAASILAKVTRDRIMLRLAEEFPCYGFERHKGYGTRDHLEAIRRCGLSPVHRRSFSYAKVSGNGSSEEGLW
ncbi:ribonuclease HII [Nitratifractor sp.]